MSEITRSSSPARKPRKKKKSQIPFGLLVLIGIVVVGILLGQKSGSLAMFWVFGCCFGYILQRSRFCFTASLRDPWISGSTAITKAVLIAFAITTIGFTAIKYGTFINSGYIPGQGYIQILAMEPE